MKNEPPVVSGDGSVKRDYLYIDDAIEGILLALEADAHGLFNIGSGIGTSVLELASAVIRASGKEHLNPRFSGAQVPAASQASLVYDIGKARRDLGFTPRESLVSGLQRLMASS